MDQDKRMEELYALSVQTLTTAAVALFHQVLVRESKKEILDKAIEGTSKIIEEITNDYLSKNKLGPLYDHILSPETRDKILKGVQEDVKNRVKDYAYKTYISELIHKT